MIFKKRYKQLKYLKKEVIFYESFKDSINIPKIININEDLLEIDWEYIYGNVPSIDEVLKTIYELQNSNYDKHFFSKKEYDKLEDLINFLYIKNIIKKKVNFSYFKELNDFDFICHGDAHIYNFIKNDNFIYLIDSEFCCLGSPMCDFAKLFIFSHEKINLIYDIDKSYKKYQEIFEKELFLISCSDYYGIKYLNKGITNIEKLEKQINLLNKYY